MQQLSHSDWFETVTNSCDEVYVYVKQKTDPDWWTLKLPAAPQCGVAWTQNERVEPTGVTQSVSPRANEDRSVG